MRYICAYIGREVKNKAEFRASVRATCVADTPPVSPYCKTQTAIAMMLYYGIYEEKEKPNALYWLKELVYGAENRMQVGVIGVQSLLRVLCDNGMADLAYEIAMSPDRVSYGNMVAHGATSLWEFMHTFKPGTNEVTVGRIRSLNHHFWGDIAAWYITYIAGIRINEMFDDVSCVNIAPYFINGISHASAEHITPFGTVKVCWQRSTEKEIILFVQIPCGMHGFLRPNDDWTCEDTVLQPGGNRFVLQRR